VSSAGSPWRKMAARVLMIRAGDPHAAMPRTAARWRSGSRGRSWPEWAIPRVV